MSVCVAKSIVTTELVSDGAQDNSTQKSELAEWARLGTTTKYNGMQMSIASMCREAL